MIAHWAPNQAVKSAFLGQGGHFRHNMSRLANIEAEKKVKDKNQEILITNLYYGLLLPPKDSES